MMALFPKTLREVELENEVFALKRKLYELEIKSGMFNYNERRLDASSVEEIRLDDKKKEMIVYASIDSRITHRFGLEVQTWGRYANSKAIHTSYYIEHQKFLELDKQTSYAPYLMDEIHKQFLLVLAHAKEMPDE